MLQSTIPVYIAELSSTQLRGFLINSYSFWFCVGQVLSPVVLRQTNASRPYDYKLPILTQWAFIGVMILIFLVLPESPWWLVSRGDVSAARKVLERVYGNIDQHDIDSELNIICETIYHEQRRAEELKETSWITIFKGRNAVCPQTKLSA